MGSNPAHTLGHGGWPQVHGERSGIEPLLSPFLRLSFTACFIKCAVDLYFKNE